MSGKYTCCHHEVIFNGGTVKKEGHHGHVTVWESSEEKEKKKHCENWQWTSKTYCIVHHKVIQKGQQDIYCYFMNQFIWLNSYVATYRKFRLSKLTFWPEISFGATFEWNETFCPTAKKVNVKAGPLLQYFASWYITLPQDASAGSLLQLASLLISIQKNVLLPFVSVSGFCKLCLKPVGVAVIVGHW